MNRNDIETIRLRSGCNVSMSADIYDSLFCNFSESQYINFNNFINAGLYFPQICQFIAVMIAICNGATSFREIIYWNLSGILFMLAWFWLRLYRFPGLAFLSCLFGGNVFRLFLHFIPIAYVAFFVAKDWKVLLFCVISGAVITIVKSFIFVKFSNVAYHNEVVSYVYQLRYK